jgi:hypothetical protein
VAAVLAAALAACTTSSLPSGTALEDHSAHEAQTGGVKADLAARFGMTFEPAGPHHEIGRAPDGVQLDLVGIPPEELVLSLPSEDRDAAADAGVAYLPSLRELLPGPDPVWNWIAAQLGCRRDVHAECRSRISRGGLTAQITEEAGYIVVVVTGVHH